jgi:hypothetical protein
LDAEIANPFAQLCDHDQIGEAQIFAEARLGELRLVIAFAFFGGLVAGAVDRMGIVACHNAVQSVGITLGILTYALYRCRL